MKRVTKSVTALLLALVLSLTLLPAQALAADTAPAQTTYIGSYVNPAYVGKIGIPRRQSTLSVQTAQITQPKKAGTVYTKEAAGCRRSAQADGVPQRGDERYSAQLQQRCGNDCLKLVEHCHGPRGGQRHHRRLPALGVCGHGPAASQASPSIQAISIPLRMSLTRRTATPSGSPPPRRRPR